MPDRAAPSADQAIGFGPFRLLPARQLLLEADKPVRLGSRAVRHGDAAKGLQLLGNTLGELRRIGYAVYFTAFLGEFAEALGRVGQVAQGLVAIDEAIELCERHEERWHFAELLRIKGEIVLQQGSPDAAATAEQHFRHSLDLARRQDVLSWELRTAMSLSRLQRDQGCIRAARDLLASVYGRFTEGFGAADLKAARELLEELP